ncbi:Protein of unknown function [Bacillus mycoides]|nr:Protein of unknown function [Bacillus mycoides]SCM88689.1 Protein of unknown function [Bacillus mycoides]
MPSRFQPIDYPT